MTTLESQTAMRIDLGGAWIDAAGLRDLAEGSIITLDTAAAGAVEICCEGLPMAEGTLVNMQDRLGVRIDGMRTV